MWTAGQVPERMSPISAADVGTVAVITVSGLIGPKPTLAPAAADSRTHPEAVIRAGCGEGRQGAYFQL